MQKLTRLTLSRHPFRTATATVVLATFGGPLLAQSTDAPPARTRFELPAAERQAMEATKPSAPSPTPEELLPSAGDANTLPPAGEQQTVVKQVRLPDRTTEIRVTPALTGRTWTMTTREGREPISPTATSPGLSVPSLFTFEWGRTSDAPTANAPPPPSSATPR